MILPGDTKNKEMIMKPSSIVTCVVASVLVVAFALLGNDGNVSSASGPSGSIGPKSNGAPRPERPYPTRAKKATIFLHGLMVGRYKEGNTKKRRFELGVVKRVPEHKFGFNVYLPGGVCEHIDVPKKSRWIFEVQRGGAPIPRDIQMYRPSRPDVENSDFILNIEQLHTQTLDRFKKPFSRIFYFHNGIVKTECLTDPLQVVKADADVEGTPSEIGAIAEVVGVEIVLNPGEQLVCKNLDDPAVKLWVNDYDSSGEVEGRLINLPPDHKPIVDPCKVSYREYATTCPDGITHQRERLSVFLAKFDRKAKIAKAPATSRVDSDVENPTHFQFYYYLVFKKDRPDRFELINPTPKCYELTNDKDEVIMTVPPYRCGMVLVRADEIQ